MELAKEIGLVALQGRDATGNPLLEDDEAILESFQKVILVLSTESDQGPGTLYFMGRRLLWLSSKDERFNVGVPFESISMHAIANGADAHAGVSIYIQLDAGDYDDYDNDNDNDNNGDNDTTNVYPEMSLIPSDPHLIEEIFRALCDGAERNPDPDIAEEGQGTLFFDKSEALAGAEFACLAPDAMEDSERFEDADEEE